MHILESKRGTVTFFYQLWERDREERECFGKKIFHDRWSRNQLLRVIAIRGGVNRNDNNKPIGSAPFYEKELSKLINYKVCLFERINTRGEKFWDKHGIASVPWWHSICLQKKK